MPRTRTERISSNGILLALQELNSRARRGSPTLDTIGISMMTHRSQRFEYCLLLVLGALAPALTLAPLPARAQGARPVIEEMQVDLWPEYDRPSTLVMYRFRLRSGTDLSVPVEIPIPASAGEPHAVAWSNPQNSLFVADFTRRVEGDRAVVSARLGSTEGQLEFYSNIAFDGRKRTFRFEWPGGVAVGSLSFQVQQPTGASAFHVTPQPSQQWMGEDGFSYVRVDLGPQDAAATPGVEVTYEKDSNALSAPEKPPAPPVELPAPSTAPAPAGAASGSSSSPSLLYAIGGLLMGVGASWLVWSSLSSRSRARPTAPARRAKVTAKETRAIYCHQCGNKEDPSASFCTECGTELLKSSD